MKRVLKIMMDMLSLKDAQKIEKEINTVVKTFGLSTKIIIDRLGNKHEKTWEITGDLKNIDDLAAAAQKIKEVYADSDSSFSIEVFNLTK